MRLLEFLRSIAWQLPEPIDYIFIVFCAIILTLWPFILILLIYLWRKHKAFYTPANCSVCGMPTGHKGNKRFLLENGYMCQVCADKLLVNAQSLQKAGPKFFIKPPHNFSVGEVKEAVAHYNEVGRDQVLRERAALLEQRRQQGVSCPMCGGHSISATSSDVGSDVWITCLNCGYRWRPGQHRSW